MNRLGRVAGMMGAALGLTLAASAQGTTPASVKDTGVAYVLANEWVTATISKTTGDMVSLKYKGIETMGYVSGHHAGYWEQNPSGTARLEAKVTIDPATNSGERAEVSIKGWSDGEDLGAHRRKDAATKIENAEEQTEGREAGPPPETGRVANAGTKTNRPAGNRGPGLLLDLEIRYTLGSQDHGIYTYAIYTHEATYGATQLGESRYGFKLNQKVFDWLSVDAQRNQMMANGSDWDHGTDLNMKEARRLTTGIYKGRAEHKYDYCADLFETPAFGWSSSKQNIGLYFINPSMEYLSSGPFHFELTGHLDDGDGGDPTLLDYWRGSHYGGSNLPVNEHEEWSKVVGPIFVYLDSAATPDAMFTEAKQQARAEAAKWPYPWVKGVDYPLAPQRATVTGQLSLHDSQSSMPNLLVGLAAPDADGLTWQTDAKHYEFWAHGTPDGRFSIPNVRAGTYQLIAVADGVLGEYKHAAVTVAAGGTVDLGKLEWIPGRYGPQIFQIGTPNRSASEFRMGDDHWHWGLYVEYAKLFPHDVNFTVGKSDPARDWFIYQVPHAEGDESNGRGQGRATPWTIHFTVPDTAVLTGHGILRLGLSAVGTKFIAVDVNGKPAGQISGLSYNATINRDGIEGSWVEKDLAFDAKMLHPGENTMVLTVPAGGLTSGVAYDVVRLELSSR